MVVDRGAAVQPLAARHFPCWVAAVLGGVGGGAVGGVVVRGGAVVRGVVVGAGVVRGRGAVVTGAT